MTTTTQRNKPSISPGELQQGEGESPFLLNQKEWYTVQRYVENGLKLPTSESDIRNAIKLLPAEPFTDYERLKNAYSDVKTHCGEWKTTIFPATVQLANDIRNYSTKAPIYYRPINQYTDQLIENPNNEIAKKKLKQILENLSTDASNYASNASCVYDQIIEFVRECENDKRVLDNVATYYNDKYGVTSEEGKRLLEELNQATKDLEQANKDYDDNVTVAATTATYYWATIFGFIAAITVASIYGSAATAALNRAKEAEKKIGTLNADIQRNSRLNTNVKNANDHMKGTVDALTAALPVIQRIKSVWNALSSDLTQLRTIIDQDIAQAPDFIRELGVETAIEQWQKMGRIADAYVAHAYITVQGEAQAA